MKNRDSYLIERMIECSSKIIGISHGISEQAFEDDWTLNLAVMQLLIMLGESARKLSKDLKEMYPLIPFRETVEFGNSLIEKYDEVDLPFVWTILQSGVPELLIKLRRIWEELLTRA